MGHADLHCGSDAERPDRTMGDQGRDERSRFRHLKRYTKSLNHLTLSEIKDLGALGDM